MPYVAVEDFRAGLDTRRIAATAPPGSLRKATNVHITRGGEIEKAKRFVAQYVLPAGTFFLIDVNDTLYVFGSAADPGVPSPVVYQRLQHPDGLAMTEVLAADVFETKIFALARFEDGIVYPFFDGQLVTDFTDGVVRAGMEDLDGVAAHLAALIDADGDLTAGSSGAVITITGQPGAPFEIAAAAVNGGGTDNQTATVATPTASVEEVAGVVPSGSVTITAGTPNVAATGTVTLAGSGGSVDNITVDGTEVLGDTVVWAGSLSTTASAVAAQINTYSSPTYTATADGAVVTISGSVAAGADMNLLPVVSSVTGGMTSTDANMAGGVTNAVTSIKVDGVEILGARISWETSHSATATALANQIDGYTSSPEYTGRTEGARLIIEPTTGEGSAANGRSVTIATVGDVSATTAALSGGVNPVAAVAQVSTVTLGGTFDPGDKFTVTIDDKAFGAGQVAGLELSPCVYVLKQKVYLGAGSVLLGSAVREPMKWNADDTGTVMIDMAAERSRIAAITGFGSYRQNLVVFGRRDAMLWFVDPDPAAYQLLQPLENLGAVSGDAIVPFTDSDLFFLSDAGIRSVRARDSSDAATVSDVGSPIDLNIIGAVQAVADPSTATAMIDPIDNRYLMALDDEVYVFSFFSSSKVSAWSVYEPGFPIERIVASQRRIYARSGNTIYLLGGEGDDTYAETAEVELPFLNMRTAATFKMLTGLDVIAEGEWHVYVGTDPNRPDVDELVAIIDGTTTGLSHIPLVGYAPLVKVRMVHEGTGAARIGSIFIHYQDGESG